MGYIFENFFEIQNAAKKKLQETDYLQLTPSSPTYHSLSSHKRHCRFPSTPNNEVLQHNTLIINNYYPDDAEETLLFDMNDNGLEYGEMEDDCTTVLTTDDSTGGALVKDSSTTTTNAFNDWEKESKDYEYNGSEQERDSSTQWPASFKAC